MAALVGFLMTKSEMASRKAEISAWGARPSPGRDFFFFCAGIMNCRKFYKVSDGSLLSVAAAIQVDLAK